MSAEVEFHGLFRGSHGGSGSEAIFFDDGISVAINDPGNQSRSIDSVSNRLELPIIRIIDKFRLKITSEPLS